MNRLMSALKVTSPLVVAVFLCGGGIANPRCASATAIGCVFVSDGQPVETTLGKPDCSALGPGCYGCVSHASGGPGYVVCAMFPDGSGLICVNSADLPGDGWSDSPWDWVPPGGTGAGGNPCSIGANDLCPAECASCRRQAV